MPPRGDDWYEEDEWHERDWHRGGYAPPAPPAPRRSAAGLLDTGYHTSSRIRSRSTGAAPAPNVYVYTSQHNDNEHSPSPDRERSRSRAPRGRRDVRTEEIIDKLDDIDYDVRRLSRGRPAPAAVIPSFMRDPSPGVQHMELELARERAARERLEDRERYEREKLEERLRRFDGRRETGRLEDLERLKIAELNTQRLEEERLRAIEKSNKDLYRKKYELDLLKEKIEREKEDQRLDQREKEWKSKLELERLREEQKRHLDEIRREEERAKILAQEKDKVAQAKAERERIKLEIEHKEKEEDAERKAIIEKALAKEKLDKAKKDAADAAAVAAFEKKVADEKKKQDELREKFRQEEEAKKRKDKEEEDKWRAKLKAKEDEEKEKKKAEDKKIEDEMHKKLAKFGFQENQIEAVLKPEKAANLPVGYGPMVPVRERSRVRPVATLDWRNDVAPTYIKIKREHIEIETLRYFELKWEYDATDPDYIIILEEMDEHATQHLFDHTRKIRRGGAQLLIEDRGRHGDKNQYAFVRRRKPSASPSRRRERSTVRVGIGSLF